MSDSYRHILVFDTDRPESPRLLSLKSGVDYSLEEEADRWLAKSREGVTALSEKRDYLTRDQLALRASREVLNQNGFSDEALMSGMFRRCFNPLFGHRPGRHLHDDG